MSSIISDVLYTFIYISILCWVLYRHQRQINFRLEAGTIIWGSYIVYAVIGAFWFFNPNSIYGQKESLRLIPFVYLALTFWIAFRPIFQYDKFNIKKIESPSMNLMFTFIIVYTLCALSRIVDIYEGLFNGIIKIILDSDAGANLYTEAHNQAATFVGVKRTNIAAVIFNKFSPLICFFLFYYLTLPKRNKFVICCLAFCIIVKTLHSLSTGLRTQFTMLILDILCAYFVTRPVLSKQTRQIVRKYLLIIGIVLFVPFIALSASRFGNKEGGTTDGLIYYIGEAPYYFNEYAFDSSGERHGDRTCNMFKRWLGLSAPDDIMAVRAAYPDLKLHDNVFSTFVGDFVVDFGIVPTIIIFGIFSLFFSHLTRRNGPNTIPFYRLILIFFSMSICAQGGLYLFSYSFDGNLTILAFFFTYCLFSIDYHIRQKHNYS